MKPKPVLSVHQTDIIYYGLDLETLEMNSATQRRLFKQRTIRLSIAVSKNRVWSELSRVRHDKLTAQQFPLKSHVSPSLERILRDIKNPVWAAEKCIIFLQPNSSRGYPTLPGFQISLPDFGKLSSMPFRRKTLHASIRSARRNQYGLIRRPSRHR